MYPITFHPQERTISPPMGEHEDISGLRVVDIAFEDGSTALVSCWVLTPEEKEQIATDGKVYLAVMGRSMPPVLLTTNHHELGV